MEKYYLAALKMVEGIGNVSLHKLINFFCGAEQIWHAKKNDLRLCGILNEKVCNNLFRHREKIDVHKLALEWDKKGIKICAFSEKEYPNLLRNIYNPPIILYYRGTLPLNERLLAIVGARRATVYGKNTARMFASELVDRGFVVVSGGARGIDTAAHFGAVEKGKTLAVMGCGVDIVYPPENGRLFASIVESGAVLSEYPPGTPACPAFFPARNRIISGLSLGTLIVEASLKSGALITADFALEQNRDVFAVPGNIFSELSKGPNQLIKQGAKLVQTIDDIFEEYGLSSVEYQPEDRGLTNDEMAVCNILQYDTSIGIEEIVMKTNLSPSIVTYILLQLELRGLAAGQSGQRYVRVAREGIR